MDRLGEAGTAAGPASRSLLVDRPDMLDAGPAILSLRLLGGVSACWNGVELQVPGRGALALLAVLATQERPRTREAIASDLWPDGGRSSAAWLRQALWQLRRAFVEAGADATTVFEADPERVGFRVGLRYELDADRFQVLVAARQPDLEAAIALYGGEYTEGLDHECFARDRERLSDLYEDALAQLGRRCLADGDLVCARSASLRLVARDPLREEAHATLIELYGQTGSRDQVVRQYRRLQRLLAQELGIEPLAETQESFRVAMWRTSERSVHAVTRRALNAAVEDDASAYPSAV